MNSFGGVVFGNILYELFDSGLANILGLETLNHGTNPVNYLQIRVIGGDPNHGNKMGGSTKGWINDNTENYFYIFKDNEFGTSLKQEMNSPQELLLKCIAEVKGIGNRMLARAHATLSGYNFVAQVFSDETHQSIAVKYFSIVMSCISGACSALISPRIRFRFSKIDSTRFENDPAYGGFAYRTKQAIEPWRIGLLGSLLTGVNLAWFSRVKANPLKILTGVIQLTFVIAITILSAHLFCLNPAFIIAGALIA